MRIQDLAPASPRGRVAEVDLMRGLAMIVMALDHVRDFFSPTGFEPTDLTRTSPALFLTRWITHFCAPTFVFLAGTSVWLYWRTSGRSRGDVQRFLLTRGLWLIVLELLVVSPSWSFSYASTYVQVIWAIGWSMIALALLLYLPFAAIVTIAVLMIAGHDLLDGVHAQAFGDWAPLWGAIHEPYFSAWRGHDYGVLYPLVPWIGVMALGFACGRAFELDAHRRARVFLAAGAAALALFLALRLSGVYGDPHAWAPSPRGGVYSVLAVLNVAKYPPSLLYLLMTLGGMALLLPVLARWRGAFAERLSVFGRVPLFFYLVHIPAIHLAALVCARIAYGTPLELGRRDLPAGYEPSLLRVYAVWIVVVVALYFPSRWYAGYKRRHADNRWLAYL